MKSNLFITGASGFTGSRASRAVNLNNGMIDPDWS